MSETKPCSIFVYDIQYYEENSIVLFGKASSGKTICWRWINLPHSIIYFQLNAEAEAAGVTTISKEDLIDFYPALQHARFTFDPVPRKMCLAPVISFDCRQQKDTPLFVTAEDSAHPTEFLRDQALTATVIAVTIWSYSTNQTVTKDIIHETQALYETPVNRQSMLFSLAWRQSMNMMEYIILKHGIRTCEWLTIPPSKIRQIVAIPLHITGLGLTGEWVISYENVQTHIKVGNIEQTPPLLDVVSIDYNTDHPNFFSIVCGQWNIVTGKLNIDETKNSYFYEYRPAGTISTTPTNMSTTSSSSSSSSSPSPSAVPKKSLCDRVVLPTILSDQSEFDRACTNSVKTCLKTNLPNLIITYRQFETFQFVLSKDARLSHRVIKTKKSDSSLPVPKQFGILWCQSSKLFQEPALMIQAARRSHSLPRLYAHYLDPSIHPYHFASINWALLEKLETLTFLLECSRFTHCPLQIAMDFRPSQMNMWQLMNEAYHSDFIIRQYHPDLSGERAEGAEKGQDNDKEKKENEEEEEEVAHVRTGGLILNVQPSVFEYVIEVDFQSCYPVLVDCCNLDYSTLRITPLMHYQEQHLADIDSVLKPNTDHHVRGIIPNLFHRAVALRQQYRQSHPTKAKAIKQITNSLYGLLWQPVFRFYHPHFSQYIVSIQRSILLETKRLVEEEIQCKVIGGHTDSMMIHLQSLSNSQRLDIQQFAITAQNVMNRIQERFPMLLCSISHKFPMVMTVGKNLYCGLTLDLELITKGCSTHQFDTAAFVDTFRQKMLLDILTCFHHQNGQSMTVHDKDSRQQFFQRFLIHLEELVKRFTCESNQFNYHLLLDELVICRRLNESDIIYALQYTPSKESKQKELLNNPAFIAAQYLQFVEHDNEFIDVCASTSSSSTTNNQSIINTYPKCKKQHFEPGDVIEYLMVRDFTNDPYPTPMPVELARNFPADTYWYFTKHLLTHVYPILHKLGLFTDMYDLEDLLKSYMRKEHETTT